MSRVEDSGFYVARKGYRQMADEARFEQNQRSYDEAFPSCTRMPWENSFEAYKKHFGWDRKEE